MTAQSGWHEPPRRPETVSDDEKRRRTERLVDAIFEPNGTQERTHETDCPACDIASEIAGGIAVYCRPGIPEVQPDGTNEWNRPSTYDEGVPGDTWLDVAYRIAAYELHKKLPGHAPNSPRRRI